MSNLPTLTSLLSAMNTLERAASDFETGLATTTAQKASTDGKVTVVANGLGRVVSIAIDSSLVAPGDPVALAGTVMTVANAAMAAAIATASTAAVSFATALSLPGLPAYGGPAPSYVGFGPTASLASATSLANNPCQQTRTFQCRSGPVLATVDADRRITALVFDSPLPEFVPTLQSSAIAAINCAVAKSTTPPDDVHNGVGGIVGATVGFESLALYANGSITLDPPSQVKGLGCQGSGMIGNAGTGAVSVGSAASVGTIVSRGPVNIASAGAVHGSITSEGAVTVFPGGVVDGPIKPNTAVVLPILKVGVVFPTTAQAAINLFPATTSTAAPGYYRSITLGSASTLNVSSGVYYTDSLSLGGGSRLVINATNGPVIFWVKTAFSFTGAFVDAAGVFPRIWVGYIGTAAVSLTTAYQGSLVAPNAAVTLFGGNHTGSFHARSIELSFAQTVCFRPFELPFSQIPGARPPDPPPVPVAPQTLSVLGFEDATAWTSTTATLALVTTPITQGASALRASSIHASSATLLSRVFASKGIAAPLGQLLLDVFIPTAAGSLDIQAKIPSAGLTTATSFGSQSLVGKPTNRYSTLTYTMPATVAAAIASGAADVTLSIVFSVSATAGTFFLDNIRFA